MCVPFVEYMLVGKKDVMLSTKEASSKGKRGRQIRSILSLVDVNTFLAVCIDVEPRLEKP